MADSIFHVVPDQRMAGRGNVKNHNYIFVIYWLLTVVTYRCSTVGSMPCEELLKDTDPLAWCLLKTRTQGSMQWAGRASGCEVVWRVLWPCSHSLDSQLQEKTLCRWQLYSTSSVLCSNTYRLKAPFLWHCCSSLSAVRFLQYFLVEKQTACLWIWAYRPEVYFLSFMKAWKVTPWIFSFSESPTDQRL